jgi:hypothetical protein
VGREPPGGKGDLDIVPMASDSSAANHAARLSVDFSGGGKYAALHRFFIPPMDLREVRFSVKTVGNVTGIVFRTTDATWQTHQQLIPLKETTDWQRVTITTFSSLIHWDGKNDGKWYPPALGMAIVVDNNQLGKEQRATLYFDDAEAVLAPPTGIIIKQTKLGNVFIENEPVRFRVWSDVNPLRWSVSDFWGRTVCQEKGIRLGAQESEMTIPVKSRGYFKLSITSDGKETPCAETCFAILSPMDVAQVGESPFGVQTHFGQDWNPELMPLISRTGIKNVRDEIYWENIELTQGKFTFPDAYDKYMRELKAHHIKPLIILTYRNRFYDDGQTPYTEEGLRGYTGYGRQVLGRYGKQIEWVEVYNEYNIPNFCKGPADCKPSNYFEMLKKTHEAVKQVRPDVTVVGCATAGVPWPWLEEVFRLGGLNYMDVVSIHPYHQPHPPEGAKHVRGMDEKAETLIKMIKKYSAGNPKPVWVTEVGWPTHGAFTKEAQAEFFVRCGVLLLSAGTEKVFWFKFMDGLARSDHFGLVCHPIDPLGAYVPKPSYVACAVMTRQLAGAKYVAREDVGPDVRDYLFKNDRGEIRVMWCMAPRTVAFETDEPPNVVDMMGDEKRVGRANGEFRLPLSSAPVYVLGPVKRVRRAGP